ncbi:OmpH family outer membrane protein [Pantoea sp. SoEX]|uniref:OmpH family outer membrane protein n=1 Tax=Pantoea sp. SoEX TaxID=2576763 RepID=UPI0013583AAA|nr:OmpH family outer membrane protein [Pantoea sp. SoEX]MXP51180.1 molecular chaperone [Pantoea sp. SoEX]
MKQFFYLTSLFIILILSNYVQAYDNIAVVNIYDLLQKLPKKTNFTKKIENEFKIRANELKIQEGNLKDKLNKLNRNKSVMKLTEKKQLEKDIIKQQNIFSLKAQKFEQDRRRCQIEERNKILIRIQNAIKKIAKKHNYNLILDSKSTAYVSNTKDITKEVLKNIK